MACFKRLLSLSFEDSFHSVGGNLLWIDMMLIWLCVILFTRQIISHFWIHMSMYMYMQQQSRKMQRCLCFFKLFYTIMSIAMNVYWGNIRILSYAKTGSSRHIFIMQERKDMIEYVDFVLEERLICNINNIKVII